MSKYALDSNRYAAIARKTAAESCVMLKNDNNTLPFRKNDEVAVFGRCAFSYYKSGLGSGGLVNTKYTVGILEALRESEDININEGLLKLYEEWLTEHPYNEGNGWGTVPWSQEEMPVTDEMLEVSKTADIAVVIIGRTAGEDQDNSGEEGSYLLTAVEKEMIAKVSKAFKRTAVLLNVGNIVDMKWVEESNPAAVMYVWQGGQEGGNGVVDVLTGKVTPSGKLTDTIAKDITDYPSTSYFGDPVKNYYKEDIYVGYRYFESCAKEKVLYPFGYGLSYTTFETKGEFVSENEDTITVSFSVTNTGDTAGKEVVQVYVEAAQGKLGKPLRNLAGFYKTKELQPNETEEHTLSIKKSYFASYDDSGVTGNKSCFLLESGVYKVYIGSDVRSAKLSGEWMQNEHILETLEEACAPVEKFERFKLVESENGYRIGQEEVPVRTIDPKARMMQMREADIEYIGDRGYKLGDVLDGKVSMDEFVAQLSDEDLICLFHGEGMCSLKVTPGTAGAFGGLTDSLKKFGIPAACCADGPSGIRMDCGTKAFSLPNGTALGSTFDVDLVKELYQMLSLEMRKNRIDTILGPGINLHRNPLNGRNFEYVSEDPVLTGLIAAAQLQGLEYAGVSGTIKHFCANNQEHERTTVESVVSERALRELYLKCFEIAVKEGKAESVMTTYGPVNGLWTAGSFDLNTVVLRKEWGFKGIVMTDWWADANDEGEDKRKNNRAPMLIAQNDLYMCCADAIAELDVDNIKEKLNSGEIKRFDLQRNAKNILTFIMNSPAMLHELGRIDEEELAAMQESEEDDVLSSEIEYHLVNPDTDMIEIDGAGIDTTMGTAKVYGVTLEEAKDYSMSIEMKSDLSELAQLPVSVYFDNIYRMTISFNGTNGENVEVTRKLGNMFGKNHYIKLVFGANGIHINKIKVFKDEK